MFAAINENSTLIGQAELMQRMFNGDDLSHLADDLIHHAERHPDDASALLDLSTILLLRGDRDTGLLVQTHALSIAQTFNVQQGRRVKVLALKAPGFYGQHPHRVFASSS